MKRKRTYGLSCERALNDCIFATMAKLGHFPTRRNYKEAWFSARSGMRAKPLSRYARKSTDGTTMEREKEET